MRSIVYMPALLVLSAIGVYAAPVEFEPSPAVLDAGEASTTIAPSLFDVDAALAARSENIAAALEVARTKKPHSLTCKTDCNMDDYENTKAPAHIHTATSHMTVTMTKGEGSEATGALGDVHADLAARDVMSSEGRPEFAVSTKSKTRTRSKSASKTDENAQGATNTHWVTSTVYYIPSSSASAQEKKPTSTRPATLPSSKSCKPSTISVWPLMTWKTLFSNEKDFAPSTSSESIAASTSEKPSTKPTSSPVSEASETTYSTSWRTISGSKTTEPTRPTESATPETTPAVKLEERGLKVSRTVNTSSKVYVFPPHAVTAWLDAQNLCAWFGCP